MRGGNPPKDRSRIIVVKCRNDLLEGILFICLGEEMLKYERDVNRGVIRIVYTIKYMREELGLNTANSLNIHPM